jgi:hypothetical protein
MIEDNEGNEEAVYYDVRLQELGKAKSVRGGGLLHNESIAVICLLLRSVDIMDCGEGCCERDNLPVVRWVT